MRVRQLIPGGPGCCNVDQVEIFIIGSSSIMQRREEYTSDIGPRVRAPSLAVQQHKKYTQQGTAKKTRHTTTSPTYKPTQSPTQPRLGHVGLGQTRPCQPRPEQASAEAMAGVAAAATATIVTALAPAIIIRTRRGSLPRRARRQR